MEAKPFEFISHTADVAVLIRGRDLAHLWRNAALAFYCVTLGSQPAGASHCRTIEIDSVDDDTLLVDWLNELIYLLYVEHLAFSQFRFDELGNGRLRGECCGARLDSSGSHVSREVKAATYHMTHVIQMEDGLSARVVFDV
jgi:SHS2 domain-containing protein